MTDYFNPSLIGIEGMMMKEPDLLTPAEVGQMFRVDAKTVTRWAQKGLLTCFKTLGGHRRYVRVEVEELLKVKAVPASNDD